MKVYVDVYAKFGKDGDLQPIIIGWDDNKTYLIDKILDVRRRASLKAGETGIRYTCLISGKQCHLFQEEDRWFVEGKDVGNYSNV